MFALKAELKYRPILVIGTMFLTVVFYIGFIIRTMEM